MKKLIYLTCIFLLSLNSFSQVVENVDFNFIDNKIIIYYDLLDCDNKYSYEVDIRFVDDRGNTIIPRNLTGDYGKITCGRKKIVEWDLFKEISKFEGNYKVIVKVVSVYNRYGKVVSSRFKNSILFSSVLPWAYTGVKFNHTTNYGFYLGVNYGLFNEVHLGIISAGLSKSIGKRSVLYFGPGILFVNDYGYANSFFSFESGILVKNLKRLSYDIGLTLHFIEDEFPVIPGLRLGIGYNF